MIRTTSSLSVPYHHRSAAHSAFSALMSRRELGSRTQGPQRYFSASGHRETAPAFSGNIDHFSCVKAGSHGLGAPILDCMKMQGTIMTSPLPPDADSSPESTSSPSPIPVPQQSSVSTISVGVASSPVQGISSLQQCDPKLPKLALEQIDPNRIRFGPMPNRTPEGHTDDEQDALCESMYAFGGNMAPIHVREIGGLNRPGF